MVSKTDRNGRVTQYGYDHLLRPTTETWLNSSSVAIRTISMTYNLANQVTSAGDSDATFTYTYDALGRVTDTAQIYATMPGTLNFTQTYDADSMRTSLAANIGGKDDFSNTYLCDNLHRLTQLTQAGITGGNAVAERRVDFGYNATGQFASINRYSDVAGSSLVASSAYAYDLAGRLTGLAHSDSSSTAIAGYGWTYDAANRITGFNFTNPAHANESAAYTYDDTNQLTDSARSGGTESDTYDANGNRTNSGFTTAADNRLLTDGTYTFTYDAEGNRTAKFIDANSNGVVDSGDTDISTYTWDYRDRLTEVSHRSTCSGSADLDVQYGYDAFNRMIDRVVTGSLTKEEHYAYDGMREALRFSGSTATTLTTRTLFGPAVDQILASEDVTSLSTAGTRSWKLTDQQNTDRDEVDDSGVVTNHISYSSFGQILAQSNAPASTIFIAYTAKLYDSLTGNQNHWQRWYDNSTNGWLSHDPIEADENSYRYVRNSPFIFIDPLGLAPGPIVHSEKGVRVPADVNDESIPYWVRYPDAPSPNDPPYAWVGPRQAPGEDKHIPQPQISYWDKETDLAPNLPQSGVGSTSTSASASIAVGTALGTTTTINGKTAFNVNGTDFYFTGNPTGLPGVPKKGSTSVLFVVKKSDPSKMYRLDYE